LQASLFPMIYFSLFLMFYLWLLRLIPHLQWYWITFFHNVYFMHLYLSSLYILIRLQMQWLFCQTVASVNVFRNLHLCQGFNLIWQMMSLQPSPIASPPPWEHRITIGLNNTHGLIVQIKFSAWTAYIKFSN